MPFWKKPGIVPVLLLWAFVTAFNWGKAYHIDDTFHLLAAEWIEQEPLRPMSGTVNWRDDPEPIQAFNQPPGLFYLIAATNALFGRSEASMHALIAVFALIALWNFHRLARFHAPGHEHLATALFACCPAFLVNQNVMTDVPMLALQLLGYRLLFVPGSMAIGPRYVFAALALSAAMFIKYSTLPLLLLFPVMLVLRRQWRWLPLSLLPVVLLAGWSAWNVHETGVAHLLDRTVGDPSARGLYVRALSFLTCLGAMAPFTPAFSRSLAPHIQRWSLRAWSVLLILGLSLMLAVGFGWLARPASDEVLRIAFTLNGLLLLAMAGSAWRTTPAPAEARPWMVGAWCASIIGFTVLFAPGMATRYVLPALPPLILLLAPALGHVPRREQALALACTAFLGIVLSLSDRAYAGYYRDMASRIATDAKGEGTLWCVGHWGWQWYAQEAGMRSYALHGVPPRPGDLIAVPKGIATQRIDPALRAVPFRTYQRPADLRTFFNVAQFAGLYTSSYGKLPWTLSNRAFDPITVYRIVQDGGAPVPQDGRPE